jgi:glycosyltransferase involved in cell wall biosynthesis
MLAAVLQQIVHGEVEVFVPRGAAVPQLTIPNVRIRRIPFPARLEHMWEQLGWAHMARPRKLLSLMGTGPILHPGKAHVMVVHDINYRLLPNAFSRAFRLWYSLACGRAAKNADVIVCFSNYVKNTLIEHLNIADDRIRVICQGPGIDVSILTTAAPFQSDRPFFLCVGSLQPHKNLVTVLRAWRQFSIGNPHFDLMVVGRQQRGFARCGFAEELASARNVIFTGYLEDDKLAALYKAASGFVYPSLEEGFGLPIVEAFYCGCPTITSNRSCLPEIAGGAACIVDPMSAEEIADAMQRLVAADAWRSDLRSRGLARARHFSWPDAGEQLVGLLRSV